MEGDLKMEIEMVFSDRFSNLRWGMCNYLQLKAFGVPVCYLRQGYGTYKCRNFLFSKWERW